MLTIDITILALAVFVVAVLAMIWILRFVLVVVYDKNACTRICCCHTGVDKHHEYSVNPEDVVAENTENGEVSCWDGGEGREGQRQALIRPCVERLDTSGCEYERSGLQGDDERCGWNGYADDPQTAALQVTPVPRPSVPEAKGGCGCSCCAWGATFWNNKREMRFLFGIAG